MKSHAMTSAGEPPKPMALVIEASPSNQRILESNLKKIGFNVFTCCCCDEGWSILQRYHNPNWLVIFCEYGQKTDQAFEFLTLCRLDEKVSHVPVVLIADFCNRRMVFEAFKKGIKNILVKPLSQLNITNSIKAVCPQVFLKLAYKDVYR